MNQKPFSLEPIFTATWRTVRATLSDPVRRFQFSLLLLACVTLVGTIGYVLLEGLSWTDALYMTVITLTTVGFGEVRPLSHTGRLFTIILILVGVGTVAWAVQNAVEIILGERLWQSVQQRRLEEERMKLSNHYIIAGYGRMGQQVVRDLKRHGVPFLVIDSNPDIQEDLIERGIPFLIGDATQDETLLEAGIERAQGFVAALSSDADNVLAVLTARGLNPNLRITARASNERTESKLRRAGADRVVSPYTIGGHRLTLATLRPTVHDFFESMFHETDSDIDIGELMIGDHSPLAGQTLSGCDLRRVWRVNVIGVRRTDGRFLFNPPADYVIAPGETLIVMGPAEQIRALEERNQSHII